MSYEILLVAPRTRTSFIFVACLSILKPDGVMIETEARRVSPNKLFFLFFLLYIKSVHTARNN